MWTYPVACHSSYLVIGTVVSVGRFVNYAIKTSTAGMDVASMFDACFCYLFHVYFGRDMGIPSRFSLLSPLSPPFTPLSNLVHFTGFPSLVTTLPLASGAPSLVLSVFSSSGSHLFFTYPLQLKHLDEAPSG